MVEQTIAPRRLANQRLAAATFRKPSEVVGWLGAVQSQEYLLAKWALGQRMIEAKDRALDQAFNAGEILRTHVMRPTWHFVAPADIRWMLELTAPRVHAVNRRPYQELELDEPILRRCETLIAEAVEGEQYLTRDEIGAALTQAGIPAEGRRLAYIMHHVELERVVCSGPRRGKQFTYALLDERAPHARSLPRDEARAELVRRFFTAHGPATVKDFVWWSGLTGADAQVALGGLGSELSCEDLDGQTYWFATKAHEVAGQAEPVAHLLPPFDEYTNYQDLRGVLNPAFRERVKKAVFSGVVAIDGQIAGNWRRSVRKGAVVIESTEFWPFSEAERDAFQAAAHRLGEFLEMSVVLA